MVKAIKWEKAGLLLTKEKYFFYYKLDLYFNDFYFNDFTLYFKYWISTVKRSPKIVAARAAWPRIFLCKNCAWPDFLNRKPQLKIQAFTENGNEGVCDKVCF